MTFLDTNCWLGPWPFAPLPARSPRGLWRHLESAGVSGALVSPFDALFQDDPMPANRALRRACRSCPRLLPLPVVNPAMPAWREHLAACRDEFTVPAVRLLPAYHRYRLGSRRAAACLEAARSAGLRVVITARLVDERHEHPALRVRPVGVSELAALRRRHRELQPLVQGLTRHEIDALAAEVDGVFCDLSFAEWEDTLRVLREKTAVSQLMFGSLAPLHVLPAQLDKIRSSSVSSRERSAVAGDNARRFFPL